MSKDKSAIEYPFSRHLPPCPLLSFTSRSPPCAQLLCSARPSCSRTSTSSLLHPRLSQLAFPNRSFLFEVLLQELLELKLDSLCRFCNAQGSWEYKRLPSKPPSISQAQLGGCRGSGCSRVAMYVRMRSCLEMPRGRRKECFSLGCKVSHFACCASSCGFLAASSAPVRRTGAWYSFPNHWSAPNLVSNCVALTSTKTSKRTQKYSRHAARSLDQVAYGVL